jgi:hypothetical protein
MVIGFWQKVRNFLVEVPCYKGSISQAIGIVRAYILVELFIISFSPFRGLIIKEKEDPEGVFKFMNILDNIMMLVVFVILYIILILVNDLKKRTFAIFFIKVVFTVASLELMLFTKKNGYAILVM